jgi:hypothetical protein
MESKYFNSEISRLNEEYLNVEGFMEFADEENFAGQEMMNADAAAEGAVTSDPIIITVTNTTTDNISNVEVLYASRRLANNATTGVSFGSGIPNVTYTQILNSIIFSPFTVGLTRLISSNTSQIQSVFTITTYSITGSFVGKPQIPTYDSYQYQTGQIDLTSPYILNGNTSFVLATLYASTTLTIQFYPAAMVNQVATLANGQVVRKFARPRVNPALGK